MKQASALGLLLLLAVSLFVFPVSADTAALTDKDITFLDDLITEGIPLLYEIPAAMKTGFDNGADGAVSTIAAEKKANLSAFTNKISGYTLSAETSALRDIYQKTAETYLADIEEYGTLDPSCGSCISKMKEMYPAMKEDARSFEVQLITFFQKFDAAIPA